MYITHKKKKPDTYTRTDIGDIRYTFERSNMAQLNADFIPVGGKTFETHIAATAQSRGAVLEIGGGIAQTAAQEILAHYPNIGIYSAAEPRSLSNDVGMLWYRDNFQHIQAPVEKLEDVLGGEKYDIAFAHYVAEHIDNPFRAIEVASKLVRTGGIIFCNKIPVYREVLQHLERTLHHRGMVFASRSRRPESLLYKKGVVYVDMSMQSQGFPLDLLIAEGDYMRDFSGVVRAFRELSIAVQ